MPLPKKERRRRVTSIIWVAGAALPVCTAASATMTGRDEAEGVVSLANTLTVPVEPVVSEKSENLRQAAAPSVVHSDHASGAPTSERL